VRAIVIDDSGVMRAILRTSLAAVGFEVIEAANGKQALERIAATEAPDLALVDWNMPEMDGLAFVGAVRREPRLAAMRLMMVTTEAEASRVRSALDAGADEYLMKPFTHDTLHGKLAILGLVPR
jgi:two-component system chemotaxis response regulator CheY